MWFQKSFEGFCEAFDIRQNSIAIQFNFGSTHSKNILTKSSGGGMISCLFALLRSISSTHFFGYPFEINALVTCIRSCCFPCSVLGNVAALCSRVYVVLILCCLSKARLINL
jgi:hypothetical protein